MRGASKTLNVTKGQAMSPIVRSESLLANDVEKAATSKSLYGDHKARISSNTSGIHDRVRLNAYKNIFPSLRGKNVLHLGCGMGLVSMMMSRAAAKHVVAIDNSAIVDCAAVVAEQNNIKNIEFFRGTVQELAEAKKLPIEKFDVILCEWIGSFLTNEAILKDLLYSRDHLLVEGGKVVNAADEGAASGEKPAICPDRSSIHVVGISDFAYYQDTVEYWDNVYGFKMSAMKRLVTEEASTGTINRNSVLTTSCLAHTVDVMTLTEEQRKSYSFNYSLRAEKKGIINYLTFFVDCRFNNPIDPGASFVIGFNAGSSNPYTEVSIPLQDTLPVLPKDTISGTVTVTNKEKVTQIELTAVCESGKVTVETKGTYYFTF